MPLLPPPSPPPELWDVGDGRMTGGRPVAAPVFTDGPAISELRAGMRVWHHVLGEWVEVTVHGMASDGWGVTVGRVGYERWEGRRSVPRRTLCLEQPRDCGRMEPPMTIQGKLAWAARDARVLDAAWRPTEEPWASVRAQEARRMRGV